MTQTPAFPIPELSDDQAAALVNVDELVELGIPREVAEPVVVKVLAALDQVYSALDDFEKSYPDLHRRVLAKTLFIGGLVNYTSDKEIPTALTLHALIQHYSRGK